MSGSLPSDNSKPTDGASASDPEPLAMGASPGTEHRRVPDPNEDVHSQSSSDQSATGTKPNAATPAASGSVSGSVGSHSPAPPGLSGPAAFLVMALASLTVGAIIALLFAHIWVVEGKYERNRLSDWGISACQFEPCAQEARVLTLESEAQALRTDRIRTAQMSRLFVFVVAEVAGFALLVMGAVLVFDRVIARQQDSIVYSNWSARSEFPGLLMCFMGAVMVIWTVQSANRTAGFFEVFDRPVFLPDSNWYRNQLGIPSGSRPNSAPEARSAPPVLSPDAGSETRLLPAPNARQAPPASPPVRPSPSSGVDTEANPESSESGRTIPEASSPGN